MTAKDLFRYKRLLLAKRQELSASRSGADAPVPRAGDPLGDLIDQATADAEAELQVRLRQTESHLLRAIEEALARIDHGKFGVCESCVHPISKARLNAVPWTRHCLDCKEREHS